MKFKNRKKAIKSEKKQGFTLIEVIAVIAIIGILAAVILPKVNGYIKEAKKVKVVDQCRKVVMAVESYKLRNKPLSETMSVRDAINNGGVNKYLEGVSLDKLNTASTSLKNCYDILNGAEFDLMQDTDILNSQTITNVLENKNNTSNVRETDNTNGIQGKNNTQ